MLSSADTTSSSFSNCSKAAKLASAAGNFSISVNRVSRRSLSAGTRLSIAGRCSNLAVFNRARRVEALNPSSIAECSHFVRTSSSLIVFKTEATSRLTRRLRSACRTSSGQRQTLAFFTARVFHDSPSSSAIRAIEASTPTNSSDFALRMRLRARSTPA